MLSFDHINQRSAGEFLAGESLPLEIATTDRRPRT
jgi:hypothetical protein